MNSNAQEHYEELYEHFAAVCDADADEQCAYIEAIRTNDPDTARQLQRILGRDHRDHGDEGNHGDIVDTALGDRLRAQLGLTGSGDPVAMMHTLNKQIDGFTLTKFIGAGGSGAVYLAEQKSPKRNVAVKFLANNNTRPDAIDRFRREADVLGRLQHDGIAQVLEFGELNPAPDEQDTLPRPYFAMELVDGESVLAFADRNALSIRQRAKLMAQICEVIHFAHSRMVLHRDLKPDNILITRDGTVKVLDFGVARIIDAETVLTHADPENRFFIGTVAYMSPEQARGDSDELTVRSDVYALGVILFELLADSLPHGEHNNIAEYIATITQRDAQRLSDVNPDLDRDLDAIAARALERDQNQRYDSAAALAADLRRWLAHEPVTARPLTTIYQLQKLWRRHRRFGSVATAILILAAAASGFAALAANYSGEAAQERADFLTTIEAVLAIDTLDPEASRAESIRLLLEQLDDKVTDPEQNIRLRMRCADVFAASDARFFHLASVEYDRAHQIASDHFGPDHPISRNARARFLISAMKLGDSAADVNAMSAELKRIVTALIDQPTAIPQHDAVHARIGLALALIESRHPDYPAVCDILNNTLTELNTTADSDPLLIAQCHLALAKVHSWGRQPEAELEACRNAASVLDDAGQHDSVQMTAAHAGLGAALRNAGQLDEARVHLTEAARRYAHSHGPYHRRTLLTRISLQQIEHKRITADALVHEYEARCRTWDELLRQIVWLDGMDGVFTVKVHMLAAIAYRAWIDVLPEREPDRPLEPEVTRMLELAQNAMSMAEQRGGQNTGQFHTARITWAIALIGAGQATPALEILDAETKNAASNGNNAIALKCKSEMAVAYAILDEDERANAIFDEVEREAQSTLKAASLESVLSRLTRSRAHVLTLRQRRQAH